MQMVKEYKELKLSEMQKSIFFESLANPDQPFYFIQSIYDVKGRLSLDNLIKAAKIMVQRFPVFRTSFHLDEDGNPFQRIHSIDEVKIDYNVVDISEIELSQQQKAINSILEVDKKQEFDLEKPNLIRANIVIMAKDKMKIIFSYHHILLDGWSAGLARSNFFDIYDCLNAGKEFEESEDDTFQKICEMKNENEDRDLSYWENILSGYLPYKYDSGMYYEDNEQTVKTITNNFKIDEYDSKQLESFARKKRFTISTVCLAIYFRFLSAIRNRDDITIGLVNSGRNINMRGIEDAIGCLMQIVPIRLQNISEKNFEDTCKELQSTVLNSIYHQQLNLTAFNKLIAKKEYQDNLFNELFLFENYPVEDIKYNTFEIENHDAIDENGFPIVTYFYNDGKQLEIELQIHEFLMNEMEMYQDQFNKIIKELIRNDLSVEWGSKMLSSILEKSFAINSDKTAIIFRGKKLTYGELDLLTNKCANYLVENVKSKFVGVFMNSSIEAIVAIVSIIKAGKAYVPIDPTMPKDRCNYILNNSDMDTILTDSGEKKDLLVDRVTQINIRDFFDNTAYYSEKRPSVSVGPSDSAYMIYTSGSTGNPKGVMISHENITNFLLWFQQYICYKSDDKILQNHSLSFDNSVWEIFSSLVSGAQLVIPSDRRNVEELLDLIRNLKVTSISVTPSQLMLILDYADLTQDDALKSLKYIYVGSETVPIRVIKKLRRYINPDCKVFNEYGPTEVTITSALYKISMDNLDQYESYTSIPIGKPIANCIFEIMDTENKENLNATRGELIIGGPCVALGYYKNEMKTRESFIRLGRRNDTGTYYKTGDLVEKLPDGNFVFIGRVDDQVKIRGFRVEIGEVEKALGTMQEFKNIAVTAEEDDVNATRKLVAYYTLKDIKAKVDLKEVRRKLRKLIPDYMVPTEFKQLEKMPLNSSGKTDRKRLSNMMKMNNNDLVDINRSDVQKNSNEVKSLIESILPQEITDTSLSFYEVGGDSILCAKLVAVLSKNGYTINFSKVIHSKCIQEIIDYCINSTSLKANKSEKLSKKEQAIMELNITQRGILVDCLEEKHKKNVYMQQIIFEVQDKIDTRIMTSVFEKIFTKYPSLLTKLDLNHNNFVLKAIEDIQIGLRFFYEMTFDKDDFLTMQQDILSKGIDLFQGPLFKANIFIGNKGSLISITYHQILLDGISINNLINEIFYAYHELERNSLFELKKEPVDTFEAARIFDRRVEKKVDIEEVPIFEDSILTNKSDEFEMKLDKNEILAIKDFCKKNNITFNSFFFTAYLTLVSRVSRHSSFTAGFAIDGRDPSIEGIYETVGNLIQTVLYWHESPELQSNLSIEDFTEVNDKLMELISDCYTYKLTQNVTNFQHSRLDCMYSFHNYDVNELADKVQYKEISSSDILPYAISITVVPGESEMKVITSCNSGLSGLIAETLNDIRSELYSMIKSSSPNEDDDVSEEIQQIIKSIAGVEDISSDQSLFELGMNSLSVAVLYKKLIDIGVSIDFGDLLTADEIGDILNLVKKNK